MQRAKAQGDGIQPPQMTDSSEVSVSLSLSLSISVRLCLFALFVSFCFSYNSLFCASFSLCLSVILFCLSCSRYPSISHRQVIAPIVSFFLFLLLSHFPFLSLSPCLAFLSSSLILCSASFGPCHLGRQAWIASRSKKEYWLSACSAFLLLACFLRTLPTCSKLKPCSLETATDSCNSHQPD